MLDWIFSPLDFLAKVKIDLDDYHVPGVPNIANKYVITKNIINQIKPIFLYLFQIIALFRLKTMHDVFTILTIWLTDLDSARTDTIATLNTLEKSSMKDLVDKALTCHLRVKSKKSLSNR